MPDDIDSMLQDEEEKTRSTSPVGNKKTQGSESGTSLTEDDQQTPEEVEFNSLKGSTQERIKKLIRDKQELTQKLQSQPSVPFTQPAGQPPQIQEAVSKLEGFGIATKKTVEETVQKEIGTLRYENEMSRLSSNFNGDNGPKFEREEYEDYVRSHPQYAGYLPEDVFRMKMYPEEFRDVESQKPQPKRTISLKPSRSSSLEEPMTPESIEARLKEPDGPQWLEKNYDKVNKILKMTAEA